MPAKPPPPKAAKKKSPALVVLSFVFDIGLVAALIWYFAVPGNTEAFYRTTQEWFTKAAVLVCTKLNIKPPPPPPDNTPPPPVVAVLPPPLPPEQLAKEVPGDCLPPEPTGPSDAPAVAQLFYQPPPLPKQTKVRKGKGKPVLFEKKKVAGIPLYLVTINLNDPDSYVVLRLPNKATQANSPTFTAGHENFDSFIKHYPSAVMVNGTFFSKDEQERVMGNVVSEGQSLKYSEWENYGTTLSLREGDYPEMVTCRAEGKPKWDEHWFSLTCGPRLIKQGEVWVNPELEGFADPHVLGCGSRAAIGFPKSRDKLYLVTFLRGLSLKEEAKLMKEIGCYEAMNLDGGASKALSHDNGIVLKPGRGLTNVIVVYDCKHKAPEEIAKKWQDFQDQHG